MSYLAGPLTRQQLAGLQDPTARSATPAPDRSTEAPASKPPAVNAGDDETPLMPAIADGVKVLYLDPSAPWADEIGAVPGAARHVAGIAARLRLVYDDRAAGLDHREEWEAVFPNLDERFDPDDAMEVDYDDRDFGNPPDRVLYALPTAPVATKRYFREAETAIKNHVYHNVKVTIYKNATLKLYSRPGEEEAAFLERCDREAQTRADSETAKLHKKYEAKVRRIEEQLRKVGRRIDELEVDLDSMNRDQLLKGADALILIITGRSSTRSITGSARSRNSARSKQQRIRTEQAKADDKVLEMEELDREIREELEEINDRWEDEGARIEELEVGLEKQDIQVADLALVWLPIA